MSFIGIVPDFFSVDEKKLEFLASVPATKQEITKEEAMKGLLFKGPFVVEHYTYKTPLVAVELVVSDRKILYYDGDKLFIHIVEGTVTVRDNSLVFKVEKDGELKEIKIRALRRSDPLELTGEDMPLNKFAKKMFAEMYF